MALLVAVVLLLMVSALGIAALQSAQDEATGSGRARRKTMTLYSAESGLAMVQQQLTASHYPNLAAIPDAGLQPDQFGVQTAVRTGTSDVTLAQPIQRVGRARSQGNQLTVNAAGSVLMGVYRTDVVATDGTGGNVEIQAQYALLEGSGSYR